ncbi:CHAT domain-containing protein [Streptomyces hirsutus]|uniref:CHAT domain-containing protein n=1 Tax=Streptomyces hirsutus TaxID=35620 RepID=UPI003322DC81
MTEDTPTPVDRLRERVDRYQQDGDPMTVLDAEALAEAAAAWQAQPMEDQPDGTTSVDPYTVYVIGLLHWCRHLALPEGQKEDDLRQALRLFAPFAETAPHVLPPRAQDLLGGRGDDVEDLLADLRRRVDLYRAHGDPSGLSGAEGPDVAGRLARTAYTGSGLPFLVAHTVALFHWCRHLAVSDADAAAASLDVAMGMFREFDATRSSWLPEELWSLAGTDPAAARAAHRAMLSLSWVSDPATADRAIGLLGRAAAGLPAGHPSRGVLLAKQGVAHQIRFGLTGDPADIDRAVEAGRLGHAAVPETHLDRPRYTSNLANALRARTELADEPDPADIAAAVELAEEAVRLLTPKYEYQGQILGNLASALAVRYLHGADPADLDRAVDIGRRALAVLQGNPERYGTLHTLSRALSERFELRGGRADLDEASRYAEQAIAEGQGKPRADLGELYRQLGWIRWLGYQDGHDLADLDAALDAGRSARAATPPEHPQYTRRLVMPWAFAGARFRHTDALEDMDAALVEGRAVVARADRFGTGNAGMSAAEVRRSVGLFLSVRFDRTGDLDSLDEAIALYRSAVAEERGPALLRNLGTSVRDRARVTSTSADWREAVAYGRAAVAAAPEGHPDRAESLSQLSATLRERYEANGDAADLDEAVAVAREAVRTADDPAAGADHPQDAESASRGTSAGPDTLPLPPDPTERSAVSGGALGHLSSALLLRFRRLGDTADLDGAVSYGRLALDRAAPDAGSYPALLGTLVSALGTRYGERGAGADLDEAIDLGQRAADLTPPGSAARAVRLSNLSRVLHERYGRTRDPEDLDRAADMAEAAAAELPVEHAQRAIVLIGLAQCLHERFGRDHDPADADRSIEVAARAVAATGPGHPMHTGCLSNLGVFRVARASAEEDAAVAEADLAEAVRVYREGLRVAADDAPERFALLANLGEALWRGYVVSGDRSRAEEAVACWRRVAEHPAASAWPRLACARKWGDTAAELAEEPSSVLDAYTTAVAQLPVLAWHGLGRGDRERLLARTRGLAADAAAAAVAAGRPDRALELLEQGRGVIWSQLLDVRSDLTALREAAPDLAAELDRVRHELDSPADTLLGEPVPVPADHRMALADRWDTLVRQARSVPGFESFLRPLSAPTLCETVGDGPVLVINVSGRRCDALLVTADGVRSVPLPGLSDEESARRANAYLAALREFARGRRGLTEQVALEQAVDELLRWLWDTVTAPVLDALGVTGPAEDRPRLWWYPTGALTLLPLHAAGHHGEGAGRTVLDRVVSSYAPTLRVLGRGRADEPVDGDARLLLVALADLPELPALPGVREETAALTALLPGRCTTLDGRRATREAVAEALPRHAWVHFSCHGGQDLADPSRGGVHLHDGMLTVEELTSARHTARGELAFLSACQTALGGVHHLDEAITLTSALQHAGWRHVVGTLWSVGDAAATTITTATYRHLVRDGGIDADAVARALHGATLTMRDSLPQRPSRWAPFVHVGP